MCYPSTRPPQIIDFISLSSNLTSEAAVSYTHLDVYKRQRLHNLKTLKCQLANVDKNKLTTTTITFIVNGKDYTT